MGFLYIIPLIASHELKVIFVQQAYLEYTSMLLILPLLLTTLAQIIVEKELESVLQ